MRELDNLREALDAMPGSPGDVGYAELAAYDAEKADQCEHVASLAEHLADALADLRRAARVLMRESEEEEYLDTGDALDILRRLVGPVPSPLDAFRASAERVTWGELVERDENGGALDYYQDEREERPVAVRIYGAGYWIAEMADGSHRCPLERDEHTGTLDELERLLHEFAEVAG
jgi:hypothetical protein